MSHFSIVFCGTPEFALPSLQALTEDPAFRVTHVITQPDKPVGRKQEMTSPPVKILANELGIPVLQPRNINKDLQLIRHAEEVGTLLRDDPSLRFGSPQDDVPTVSKRPDFLVVAAYGQILSKEILAWPKIAPINLHASLLPRWRGASPIQHAILMGDQTSGVTIQRMVRELDSGPILAKEEIEIDPRETFISLHEKLSKLGAPLLLQTLKNPLKETSQDESKVTLCAKLTRGAGVVDPATMTAEEIDRHVRALVPWPGVRITIEGKEVKLIETSLEPSPDAFELSCAKGTMLYILRIQSPGRKPISGLEWWRGK